MTALTPPRDVPVHPNVRDIIELQAERGYPLVSLFVPVAGADESARKAEALIHQAEQRLGLELSPEDTAGVVSRLKDQAAALGACSAGDALAIFARPTGARSFRLPYAVDGEVVIDDTFATRNLIHGLQRMPSCLVGVLSTTDVRLYEVAGENLVDQTVAFQPPPFDAAATTWSGPFAAAVDELFDLRLAAHPQPLMLLAPEPVIAAFLRLSAVRNYVVGTVPGEFESSSSARILRVVRPQIARQRLERDRQVLQRLVDARSTGRVAAGIHEVWQAAHSDTITLLVVEERYRYPARVRPDGGLAGQHDPAPPGVIDDAVDEVIEITLRNDGEVRFVGDGHVAEWGGIAAVTRRA